MHQHDGVVRETRRRPRLLEEPLLELLHVLGRDPRRYEDGLERDDAAEKRVVGAVHDPHRPSADFRLNLVAADFLAHLAMR